MITKTGRRLLAATKPAAPSTLRAALGRGVRRAALLSVTLLAPLAAIHAIPGVDYGVGELGGATPIEAGEESKVDRLIERHGCWQGESPADVEVPGGVILSKVGEGPRYFSSDVVVGAALDHIFTAPEAGIGEVFAFCR